MHLYLCFNPEEIYDSKYDTEKDVVELLWIAISQAHGTSIDDRRLIHRIPTYNVESPSLRLDTNRVDILVEH